MVENDICEMGISYWWLVVKGCCNSQKRCSTFEGGDQTVADGVRTSIVSGGDYGQRWVVVRGGWSMVEGAWSMVEGGW